MKRKTGFDLASFFKALADPTRLRLINLIGNQEVCVCFFVEGLGTSQPKISRHLAYLRKAGVVAARREGKWMHYQLATPPHPVAAHLLTELVDWLSQDVQMIKEREKFERFCCAIPKAGKRLSGAPLPRQRPSDSDQLVRIDVGRP